MVREYRYRITTVGQHSPAYLNTCVQDVIDKLLQTTTINTIGDIGCGTGFHASLLKKKYNNVCFIGVDFSEATVTFHQNSNNKIFDKIYLSSSKTLPINDKYFDVVLSMENLEHLYYEDVLDALYELKRTSKYIIITMPTPSTVVNIPWLHGEIYEAKNECIPLTEHDYRCLESCVHKSTIMPESLINAGFHQEKQCGSSDYTYYGYSDNIHLEQIRFNGIKRSSLLNDCEYKDKYLDLLHKSLHMTTSF